MATGWRIVRLPEYAPIVPPISLMGELEGEPVVTDSGTISEPFWVCDPGKKLVCLTAAFLPTARRAVLEVSYDEGDVIEELDGPHEPTRGGFAGTPKQYRARRVTSGTVVAELTEEEIQDGALEPEP